MLKLKKIVPALVITASLLFSSQSAFAIFGINDTKENAAIAFANINYTWKLDAPADEDWKYYTNTSGTSKNLSGYLRPPTGKNYDLQLVLKLASGYEYTFSTTDNGPGNSDGFNTTLQPGDTIYFKIKSHNFDYDTVNPYLFTFTAS